MTEDEKDQKTELEEAVREIFLTVIKLTGEVRQKAVASACDGRPELLEKVNGLLNAHDAATEALNELVTKSYDEIRRLASRRLAAESRHHSIQTGDLAHQAVARLMVSSNLAHLVLDKVLFFKAVATAMRRILIERCRRLRANANHVEFDEATIELPYPSETLLAIDEVLDELGMIDEDAQKLVELRFFGGFPVSEAAEALGFKRRTAERKWTYAKAFLAKALRGAHDQ